MAQQREYDYWRNKGYTMNPNINKSEISNKDIVEENKRYENYLQNINENVVIPRKEYSDAGKPFSGEDSSYDFYEVNNYRVLELCSEAAESLGYSFVLADRPIRKDKMFAVGVDYYGHIEGRSGNIHKYVVYDVPNFEDCLQLVADFGAIGNESTIYFDKGFYYSTKNAGELRMELEKWSKDWNVALPSKEFKSKVEFKDILSAAEEKKTHSKGKAEKKNIKVRGGR